MGWISSGDVLLRLKWMATALVWNATPWISSWDNDMRFGFAGIVLAAFLGVTLPVAHVSLKAGLDSVNRWAVRQLVAWSVSIITLAPVYFIAFSAWWFYGRYTAPLLVVTIPTLAVLATRASRSFTALPAAMLTLSPVLFVVLAGIQLHSGRMILDLPINAGFVRNQVDNTLLVGAYQTGTVGFFNQNVINLDGKVDAQALYARTHGGIGTYIDSQHIDVLVEWPEFQKSLLAGYKAGEWRLCEQQPAGKSRCYERKRPVR